MDEFRHNDCFRWVSIPTPSRTTGSPFLSTPSLKFLRSLSPRSTAWRPRFSTIQSPAKGLKHIEITITGLWVSISGTWHERVQQMCSRQEPLQWLQVPLRGPTWWSLPNAVVSNSGPVPVNPDVLSSCCWHSISGTTPWTSSCCWNTSNVQ